MEWLEFEDPANPGEFFRINVSFMLSRYNCIYGSCSGIKSDTVGSDFRDVACCSQGVPFVSDEDIEQVRRSVAQLDDTTWANRKYAEEHSEEGKEGWAQNLNGKPYKTRKLNGRCIFSNPMSDDPDAPRMGCAFHVLADKLGVSYLDTKPDICWKVPLFFDYGFTTSGNPITTITAMTSGEWGGPDSAETGLQYDEELNMPIGAADEDLDAVLKRTHLAWWCVAAGTPVVTRDGEKPIETVSQKDHVLTRAGWRQVLKRWDNGERPTLKIVHEGGTLYVTEDHELLTNAGWLTAGEIRARTTHTMVTARANVGVGLSELVSTGAGSTDHHEGFRPSNIDGSRDSIQVSDIATKSVATEVIELVSVWDRSMHTFPNKNVSGRSSGTVAHQSVTGARVALEQDAIVSGVGVVRNDVFTPPAVQIDGITRLATGRTSVDGTMAVDTIGVHTYTIRHIEDGPVLPVYDLTVEGQHEYVAGNVIVHNCIDTPDAYNGAKLFYQYSWEELTRCMGELAYKRLCELLEKYGERKFKMPGEMVNNGQPTIATIASLYKNLRERRDARDKQQAADAGDGREESGAATVGATVGGE